MQRPDQTVCAQLHLKQHENANHKAVFDRSGWIPHVVQLFLERGSLETNPKSLDQCLHPDLAAATVGFPLLRLAEA